MSDTENWLERYEKNHRDVSNPLVYWAAVPMVVVGTVGLLWYLPVPDEFRRISPLLNWGSAFLMATAIYYFIISLSLAIGMLPFLLGLASLQVWLTASHYPALGVSTRPARCRRRRFAAGPPQIRWLAGRVAGLAAHDDRSGVAAVHHLPSFWYPILVDP